MKTSIRLGAGMLACAALVAVAMFTRGWGTVTGGENAKYVGDTVNLGLFSIEACDDGRCRDKSWDRLGDLKVPELVAAARALAIAGSGLAVILLAAGGIGGLAGRRLPRALVYRGAMAAFWVLLAFAAALTTWDGFAPSFSAVIGLVATGVGGLLARTAFPRRAAVVPLAAPPQAMMWPPPPPCWQCSAATMWQAQYQRWWCPRCSQLS